MEVQKKRLFWVGTFWDNPLEEEKLEGQALLSIQKKPEQGKVALVVSSQADPSTALVPAQPCKGSCSHLFWNHRYQCSSKRRHYAH